MPDNPTTASPVTRSEEVQDAIERAERAAKLDNPTSLFINWINLSKVLTAYIAQLENSSPSPSIRSEDVKEALKQMVADTDGLSVEIIMAYIAHLEGSSLYAAARSPEVEAALTWLSVKADYLGHDCSKIIRTYIAQLEASHPKPYNMGLSNEAMGRIVNNAKTALEHFGVEPQSDEGLRETLVSIVERCQFSKQHGDDIGRQNTISFILRDAQAALSRQAPIPTPGKSAKYWADFYLTCHEFCDANDERRNWSLETVIQKAIDDAAPVPTSGAVEMAREIGEAMFPDGAISPDLTPAQLTKAAAIIQQAMDGAARNAVMPTIEKGEGVGLELIGQPVNSLRVWALATQPSASDGKLREALDLLRGLYNSCDWLAARLVEATRDNKGLGPFLLSKSIVWPVMQEVHARLAQPASGGVE